MNLSCHYAFALDPKVENSALAHDSPMYMVQTVSSELNTQYLLVPCVPSSTSHDALRFPCSPPLHFSDFLKQLCSAKCARYVRKCCDTGPQTLSWPHCHLYFKLNLKKKTKKTKKRAQSWGLEVSGCQQQHVSCRTDVLSGGFIIVKAAGCLSVSSMRFLLSLHHLWLEHKTHTPTPTYTLQEDTHKFRPYKPKSLHRCTWRRLSSISDFVIHSYTHTHTHTHTYKENNQMLVPPQQPPPLHQQLLPQQQVSRHPPPAAFCQRWNTGVFKPWTRAKHTHTHTHTCRVIKRARPAAVLAEDFVETPWVCSCVCLPCCVDSHNILWMSGWRRAWRN